MCQPWMEQNQDTLTENSTLNTMPLVPISNHKVPCQAYTHNEVFSYFLTQVDVSCKPPLLEQHAKTRSEHLAVSSSIPWTQQ